MLRPPHADSGRIQNRPTCTVTLTSWCCPVLGSTLQKWGAVVAMLLFLNVLESIIFYNANVSLQDPSHLLQSQGTICNEPAGHGQVAIHCLGSPIRAAARSRHVPTSPRLPFHLCRSPLT